MRERVRRRERKNKREREKEREKRERKREIEKEKEKEKEKNSHARTHTYTHAHTAQVSNSTLLHSNQIVCSKLTIHVRVYVHVSSDLQYSSRILQHASWQWQGRGRGLGCNSDAKNRPTFAGVLSSIWK